MKGSEVKQKQYQLQQAEEDHHRTEQQLKEARVSDHGQYINIIILFTCQLTNELAMKDTDLLNVRLAKLQQDYEQQMMSSETLAGENSEKLAQLRVRAYQQILGYTFVQMKEEEVSNLKQEIARIGKIRENLQRRLRNVEENKAEVERSRDTLKQSITSLERGTDVQNFQLSIS